MRKRETEVQRVGSLLELQRRRVDLDPTRMYREIGVRSFGKGIFHKEPVSGWELGNKRVFRVFPGDLVLNNVFAWEGAVAVASAEEAGLIGSHRFLTYVPRTASVNVRYLYYLFRSEAGLELLGRASRGSAGRNRTLRIDAFEDLEVLLPTATEQDRAVAHLDRMVGLTAKVEESSRRAKELAPALFDARIQKIIETGVSSGWPLVPMTQVADINPPPEALDPDDVVSFVPMAAVEEHTGTIARPETRLAGEVSSGYKQFRAGDVIFARITPSMQNGKAAVVEGLETEFGVGSTEFHVIRPGERVLAQWIHAVVRTRSFRERAAEHFTGTAGQQRVPASFLEEVEIPVPASVAEQRAALESIGRLARAGEQVRARQRDQEMRIEALTPSILNRAFQGEL